MVNDESVKGNVSVQNRSSVGDGGSDEITIGGVTSALSCDIVPGVLNCLQRVQLFCRLVYGQDLI